jgi:hypothetical protein
MDNNDIEIDELINILKHQIFQLGIIYGYEGVREAFKPEEVEWDASKVGFEEVDGRESLSLPKFHQVNRLI